MSAPAAALRADSRGARVRAIRGSALLVGIVAITGCSEYHLEDTDVASAPDVVIDETFEQAALPGLDVLFVVDSTGSMDEEQVALAAAADDFVATLGDLGVDYQIGVTSTDPAVAGALLGRPWIITPNAEDPGAALAAALAVGTTSPPPAAGLDAAAATLSDLSGLDAGFRRKDAGLHVIFVSDGDDESGAILGDDPAGAFLGLLDSEAERTGRVAVASAVIGDVPGGCEGTRGSALPGERYAAVATASGGRIESICEPDLASVADAFGEIGVEWVTAFALRGVPEDGTVRVDVDGARVTDGWTIDATIPALVFDAPPAPGAVVHVTYTLAEGA
jgi:hypothetical protein